MHISIRNVAVAVVTLCSLVLLSACGGSNAATSSTQTAVPTANFSATAPTITSGQSTTLQWSTSNATSVAISPSVSSAALPMSGSVNVSPASTTTYTITVTGPGGTVTQTVTVTVNAAAPTATFTANTKTITAGQSVTLTWQTTNATSVSISPAVAGGTLSLSSSAVITPPSTTTYTLTATGPGGTATQSMTITVNAAPPTVAFSATSTNIVAGSSTSLQWTTTNATSVTISPAVMPGTLPLSDPGTQVSPSQTTTYVLTATGPGGTATQSVTVNVTVAPPAITSFTATPTTVQSGGFSTLAWTTTNATAVTITPNPNPNSESGPLPLSGNTQALINADTTYTLTATGGPATTNATATVTVTVLPFTLNLTVTPTTIPPNGTTSATLSWQTTGSVTSLSIPTVCGDSSTPACALPNGTATVQPTVTTTYTATATGTGGSITQSAVLTVSNNSPAGKLKHIIFMLQENRSFDSYFGMLGPYRAQRLAQFGISASSSDIDGLHCNDANCTNITLYTRSNYPQPNAPVHPFHLTTSCTENMTPSWDESHYDVDITGNNWPPTTQPGWTLNPSEFKMDNFLQTTASITQVNPNDDPNGTRPLGYYTNADLPYYYDLATFFATSDRWFSPVMANTIPNRMYLFTASSFGHVFPDPPPTGGFSPETIFAALTKAGVSWRYYYQDNSVFLAQFKDYQSNPEISGSVYPISDYYNILNGTCSGQPCDPDKSLPEVVFIERGGATGLDEHPDTGTDNQKGAAVVQNLINALL
ncbi:MAG TPA: alkaline phosphatase family protein, partial [Terriglobales bacterium]|nr:alkaline phosphatase family protein [Terriglobales bacterium]